MKPFLSVIVVSYNMDRELPRTLYSMSPMFQRNIDKDDYEVILVDNGSRNPPTAEQFMHLGMNLSVLGMENPTHSPVPAINFGLNRSIGKYVGVCIDGARMVSPGLFDSARTTLSTGSRVVVASRGRYLGTKFQRDAMVEGYDSTQEDALLEQSEWTTDGYRLFDISVFDESSGPTWFTPIAESNALFMTRALWAELGGFDVRFTSRGGGLVNLDTWSRALKLPAVEPYVLLGEGSFHQIHGGVATNGTHEMIRAFYDEYRSIHGREFEIPSEPLSLIGRFHHQARGSELHPRGLMPAKRPRRHLIRRVWSRTVARVLPRRARRIARGLLDRASAVIRFNPMTGLRELHVEHHNAKMIEASPFFNAEWYSQMYPEVIAAGYRPSRHYVRFGAAQSRQPGPLFDGVWYLDTYEDVAASGLNPLVHYIHFGEKEGRRKRAIPDALFTSGTVVRSHSEFDLEVVRNSDLFDASWYLSTNPDVRDSGIDPALHFLIHGGFERRKPGPRFDTGYYLDGNLDVRTSNLNPLVHYELHGKLEDRPISMTSD